MSTVTPQSCKNHPFCKMYDTKSRLDEFSEEDEDDDSTNATTFPEYWYTSKIRGDASCDVQEISAHLVHMTSTNWFQWSYTLTCIHDDLWHMYGIKYDLWDVAETQSKYYTGSHFYTPPPDVI